MLDVHKELKMKWKMDAYDFKARFLPSIAALAVPAILFGYFFWPDLKTMMEIKEQVSSLIGGILTPAVIASALGYFLQSANQNISKYVFQIPFVGKDGSRLPTTNYLLWNDSFYPTQKKKRLYAKIKSKYGIDILSQKVNKSQEQAVRKDIVDAVSAIRNDYRKNYKDIIVDNNNIQIGFSRNFLGGTIIAWLMIFVLIAFNLRFGFTNEWVSSVLAISLNTILEAIAILVLNQSSNEYANSLLNFFDTQM